MDSNKLRSEIEELANRRDELRRDLAAARDDLNRERESLVLGKPKVSDKLTAAQARYTALSEAIAPLDGHIDALNESLNAALKHERRAVQLDRLLEIDREAESRLAEYEAVRAELNEVCQRLGVRMVEAFGSIVDCRREFLAVYGQVAPGLTKVQLRWVADCEKLEAEVLAVHDELKRRGASLETVTAKWSAHDYTNTPIDNQHPRKLAEQLFGEAIALTQSIAEQLQMATAEPEEPEAA